MTATPPTKPVALLRARLRRARQGQPGELPVLRAAGRLPRRLLSDRGEGRLAVRREERRGAVPPGQGHPGREVRGADALAQGADQPARGAWRTDEEQHRAPPLVGSLIAL